MVSYTSVITKDGTPSVYSALFGATYHSMHGALQESDYVFIQQGLLHCLNELPNQPINIFEMGFGTGLNCLLSTLTAQKHDIPIGYHGIDSHPLPTSFLRNLKYYRFLEKPDSKKLENKIQQTNWDGNAHKLSKTTKLSKSKVRIQDFKVKHQYQLIYYDAFAPSSQPELWQQPIVNKVCELLCTGGILVTYCAQGEFFRTLQSLGLEVFRIPGPPGKREMIRAKKTI